MGHLYRSELLNDQNLCYDHSDPGDGDTKPSVFDGFEIADESDMGNVQ